VIFIAILFTLKMLGLYLYTLIISHNSCHMFGKLNKLTWQNKLQYLVTNNVLSDKNVKPQQQQNKKIKHKNPCRSRELNTGPLALKADALPLQHRVNCE